MVEYLLGTTYVTVRSLKSRCPSDEVLPFTHEFRMRSNETTHLV
jgi:hypothetical protein